jgi:hypothetical protein
VQGERKGADSPLHTGGSLNVARQGLRLLAWAGTGGLIVLATRTVSYALSPSTALSLQLERSAGGPRVLIVSAVLLGLALLASIGIVGAAALAVRERRALEPRTVVSPLSLHPLRLVLRFVVLGAACALAFALLESYLHWRAGLGWHGLHCLTGPVHRDAIPVLAALALVAVALIEAAEHLLAWARRTFARLFPRRQGSRARTHWRPPAASDRFRGAWLPGGIHPRGPPASPFRFAANAASL